MSQPAKKRYTPEEYMALEEAADHKSEYYRGEILAMAGASYNHNVIATNVVAALNLAFLDKPCVAFGSDMKIRVQENVLYTYPDASLVCGPVEFVVGRSDTVTNPTLIVEVLSPSTRNYDRTDKAILYRTIPSLQHYILIDQDSIYVEYFRRLDTDKWLLQTYNSLEAILAIPALELELSLRRIYNKVEFSE